MGRLIDESDLIKSLFDYENGKKTLGQCIDDTPTAQPEPQWILCKDRLPEIAKRVLVTLSNGNVIIAQHHTVKCGREDTWVFEPTGLQFMYDKTTVVAWMPLPEPWRGEEHE